MSKCGTAGLPAGVVVCAFLSLMCAAGAQELPPAAPQAEQPAVDGQAVPPASTPLPGLVVTTGTKKKKSKKEKIAVPASGGGGAGDGGDVEAAVQGTGISTGEGSEAADGVNLGGAAISDTGTTVFDSR